MAVRKSSIFYGILLFALVLRVASEPTASISFFVLATASLFGRKEAIQTLALCWLFTMLSPGIAPPASLGALGRYAIIFAAAASVFLRYQPSKCKSDQNRAVLYTVALGAFLIVHSLLFSVIPDVSILKAISWTVVVVTLFVAWAGLSAAQSEQLINQLFSALTLIMLASLPLVVLPLGYLRNGSGLQGILNHPQAFGPTMSLLAVWLVLGMLISNRPPWKIILLSGVCLALLLMSEARTAGLAMLGGIIASLIVTSTLSRAPIIKLFPGFRSSRVGLVVFFTVLLVTVFATKLIEALSTFLLKRGNFTSIIEAYDGARGRLINNMFYNIEQDPFTGIGFGIASDPMKMLVIRDPIFNLPIGASIEKGVLPIAVIEEVGVFGFLMFLFWGVSILQGALKKGGVAVGILASILLLNFGESTFFSVGGMGMLTLVIFGWVATGHRERKI